MNARGPGLFITLEGGEGAGKSTQARLLAERCRATGEVLLTREPGGSAGAERIRALLLDGEAGFGAVTEALLFAAARRDHVERLIRPALARGATVICDRFADSTRAYQGAAGAVPEHTIDLLEAIATDGLRPHLTLLLDLPVAAGLARAGARRGGGGGDRFEREGVAFHERVREGFLRIARGAPGRVKLIDAALPELQVAAAVLEAVRRAGVGLAAGERP
jgi:dTMP kinase